MVAAEIHETAVHVKPDHAKGYPLVGVLPYVWRDPLGYFANLSRTNGALVRLQLGPQKLWFLNDPRHIRHVLQDRHDLYRKSDFYRALRPLFGTGLLLADGDEWLNQRRVAQPAFHGPCLRGMVGIMNAAIDDMLDRWQRDYRAEVRFDVKREMTRLTLDILLRNLFGASASAIADEVYASLTTVLRHAEHRIWSLLPTPEWVPTPANREAKRALATLDRIVWDLIEDRRRGGERTGDLLDRFLAAHGPKPKILRDEVISMVMAGHETTANALTWAWLTLADAPAVTNQIRNEVRAAGRCFGDFDSIGRLHYTRAVVDEIVRLNPPVWTVSRTALLDDELGGVPIPQGDTVMMCAYALHRNPRYWTDPEAFVPERFLESAAQNVRYAYFPFGGGPRICIGMRFALTEAVLILARVLDRFHVTGIPGQVIEAEPMITLRPKGEVKVSIRPLSA